MDTEEYYSRPNVKERCHKYNIENKKHISYYNYYYSRKNPYRKWAGNAIHKHKICGYVIQFTTDELTEKAKSVICCSMPQCGVKLNWNWGTKERILSNSPSLDRINNEQVMTLDNTQIICHICNIKKRQKPLTEYVKEKLSLTRICSKCRINKSKEEFGINTNKTGIHNICKKCLRNYANKYYYKNRDVINEKSRQRYKENMG